ncbi:MAG: ATP-dependent helicase [Acidobacteria bacterium]|nr:MAG: ATP-dependent helicase [Acidobacteriota bacterium]
MSTGVLDQFHPSVQHHIVNSLGWRSLRPLQEVAAQPLLAGRSGLLLAPTAGGKTEAAMLPVFSRMLEEDWRGLSVLYVCPLRALLNNLHPRLESFGRLVGRRVGIWHGDVTSGKRSQILRDPPDVLLTTPESLEVMLVSKRSEPRRLFRNVRTLVVDEIHAFAGDDRGWHLLSVLERIERMSQHDIQRIGLSATVGNPETLLDWLTASSADGGAVLEPPPGATTRAEVVLDYVGSLENAARVIAALHRGEKRLVFVDSRNRVEQLARYLRELGVRTLLSHASLSREERLRAEEAFQQGHDCVIVATSTLELGIDVGDLDRGAQSEAPPSVASMLQRMGRTGRRPGTRSNTTILATSSEALLHAAAIVDLWRRGYVDPVEPPPLPLHVFTQQIMGLCLQERGLAEDEWPRWVGAMPGFSMLGDLANQVVDGMVARDVLWREGGILWFGQRGEKEYGRRNFMEVLSVITSPPTLEVRLGAEPLGTVDESVVFRETSEQTPLLLGGRAWRIVEVDWKRRVVQVRATDEAQKGFWMGSGRPMGFDVCQAVLEVLSSPEEPDEWSQRARAAMAAIRDEHSWAQTGRSFLIPEGDKQIWWTFAGQQTNVLLALAAGLTPGAADNLRVVLPHHADPEQIVETLTTQLKEGTFFELHAAAFEEPIKFAEALAPELALAVTAARWRLSEVPPVVLVAADDGADGESAKS